MAITIRTVSTGAENRSAVHLGYSRTHMFDTSPGAKPRRTSFRGGASRRVMEADHPGVYTDADFEGLSDAYAKTAGHDLVVHNEKTIDGTAVRVAVGESSAIDGTFTYSAFVHLPQGYALRANVSGAFWRIKSAEVSKGVESVETQLTMQEVPVAFGVQQ